MQRNADNRFVFIPDDYHKINETEEIANKILNHSVAIGESYKCETNINYIIVFGYFGREMKLCE